jgi:hypothetical protein
MCIPKTGTHSKHYSANKRKNSDDSLCYTIYSHSYIYYDYYYSGNLSVRNLNGIVKKQHCVLNSEFLTTMFVAVPKTLYKEWNNRYETLTDMVVPRSSV